MWSSQQRFFQPPPWWDGLWWDLGLGADLVILGVWVAPETKRWTCAVDLWAFFSFTQISWRWYIECKKKALEGMLHATCIICMLLASNAWNNILCFRICGTKICPNVIPISHEPAWYFSHQRIYDGNSCWNIQLALVSCLVSIGLTKGQRFSFKVLLLGVFRCAKFNKVASPNLITIFCRFGSRFPCW